jgi:hypothetical protein
MEVLLGICFWGGVIEGVAEEIGEGRKGVVFHGIQWDARATVCLITPDV